ncbi:hypothetical protein CGCA056_v002417 [Colletotrichum aenigma]|uniref:uncharacterized protein n=1 Tax=Colletotrichum aenigma TaxID=1215731 RepID=UPI0018721A0E|nr:uncharacterized protein CGCA056_v002417 [Colletotrichum aenigma]KAF5524787.1 hypothetical protein CGCA056_v002417 [Colletotrichum aenigma]
MNLIHLFLAFLAFLSITSGVVIEEPPEDALEEMGYGVDNAGTEWKVRRNGMVVDKFTIDTFLRQITIKDAWKELDTKPRLKMREIMALVWARAGMPLSQLSAVRVERIDNDETKDAIAAARLKTGFKVTEDMIVTPGKKGAVLTDSPFYLSLAKLCLEKPELRGKGVESMSVPAGTEGRLDTMLINID